MMSLRCRVRVVGVWTLTIAAAAFSAEVARPASVAAQDFHACFERSERLYDSVGSGILPGPAPQTLNIIQAGDYAQAAALAGPRTLLITDLDNTVFEPAQDLGSDEWFNYFYKKMSQEGETLDQVLDVFNKIMLATDMIPVQSGTPRLLARLQAAGDQVMALTVRNHALFQRTPAQLARLGIDFGRTAPLAGNFSIPTSGGEGRQAFYGNGVIFSDGPPKGPVLAEFLRTLKERTGELPDRIVYIDDSAKHVEDVGATVAAMGIGFVGLRYAYDDEKVRNFNPAASDFELGCFEATGRLVSNSRALRGECPGRN